MAGIGRVGVRGTDKEDRDSRVRQFPYPVSAKEARLREEKEVEGEEVEEEVKEERGEERGEGLV